MSESLFRSLVIQLPSVKFHIIDKEHSKLNLTQNMWKKILIEMNENFTKVLHERFFAYSLVPNVPIQDYNSNTLLEVASSWIMLKYSFQKQKRRNNFMNIDSGWLLIVEEIFSWCTELNFNIHSHFFSNRFFKNKRGKISIFNIQNLFFCIWYLSLLRWNLLMEVFKREE